MAEDATLREAICARFGAESYTVEGVLNRPYLAERVFADEQARNALNGLVHPVVIADFEQWAEVQSGDYVILESAILYEAGLDRLLDCVVAVLAPEPLREERAMKRDGVTVEQVRSRMAAQMTDDELHRRADVTVVNLFEEDLEATVKELDHRFKQQSR